MVVLAWQTVYRRFGAPFPPSLPSLTYRLDPVPYSQHYACLIRRLPNNSAAYKQIRIAGRNGQKVYIRCFPEHDLRASPRSPLALTPCRPHLCPLVLAGRTTNRIDLFVGEKATCEGFLQRSVSDLGFALLRS